MGRWVRLISVIAIAHGCATSHPTVPDGPLNQQITLAPGQSAPVQGSSTRILFERVLGDSRCPANALCVWAGDAVVRIAVIESTGQQRYDLHTNVYQPVPQGNVVRHGDLTITIVHLSPHPFAPIPISGDEYRATIQLTR